MKFLEILAAVGVSIGFMLLLWRLKAWLYGSLRTGEQNVYRLANVKSPAELENTVKSLLWRRARKGKQVYIIIDCGGFDSELLHMAQLFARDCDNITLE